MIHATYRCPTCHAELDADSASLQCTKCGVTYPVGNQIADFAGGAYYDNFNDPSALSREHIRGLELEKEGATTRIAAYYLPLCSGRRVLDAGCGNGISVDLLHSAGYEAWGVDLSLLRRWQ